MKMKIFVFCTTHQISLKTRKRLVIFLPCPRILGHSPSGYGNRLPALYFPLLPLMYAMFCVTCVASRTL